MTYAQTSPQWTCTCPTDEWTASADTCVSNADIASLSTLYNIEYGRKITYYSVLDINNAITTQSLSYSDTFNYYYYDAAIGCSIDEDPQKCEILANLCVLQLYSEQSTVCLLFETIVANRTSSGTFTESNSFYNDTNWVETMPWLYYSHSAPSVLEESGKVNLQVSFSDSTGASSSLTFYLARYSINGTFLGF